MEVTFENVSDIIKVLEPIEIIQLSRTQCLYSRKILLDNALTQLPKESAEYDMVQEELYRVLNLLLDRNH